MLLGYRRAQTQNSSCKPLEYLTRLPPRMHTQQSYLLQDNHPREIFYTRIKIIDIHGVGMEEEPKEVVDLPKQQEESLAEVDEITEQQADSTVVEGQDSPNSTNENYWGEEESPLQSTIQGSTTQFGQMGGQVVYLQPPSSAPKIIAILCIILASFGIIGSLLGFLSLPSLGNPNSDIYIAEFEWYKEVAYVNIFSELVGSVILLVGAIMLLNRCNTSVGLGLLRDLVMNTTYPEFATAAGGMNATVLSAISMFCSVFCGLLAAIPLMIQNNGLE